MPTVSAVDRLTVPLRAFLAPILTNRAAVGESFSRAFRLGIPLGIPAGFVVVIDVFPLFRVGVAGVEPETSTVSWRI